MEADKDKKPANTGELARRVSELERAIKAMQSPVIDCAFCAGNGKEPGVKGKPLLDDNDRFVPCTVCNGRGKARI